MLNSSSCKIRTDSLQLQNGSGIVISESVNKIVSLAPPKTESTKLDTWRTEMVVRNVDENGGKDENSSPTHQSKEHQ